jgi:hypothetical protein
MSYPHRPAAEPNRWAHEGKKGENMNTPEINNKSESGLQGLIEAMQQIPYPSSFSWDTVILVKVKNNDKLCFEIIISNGKVQIEQGKPFEPVLIIEEREAEIVRCFTVLDSPIIRLIKPDGSSAGIENHSKYGVILGITRKYLQKDSRDLLTGIIEKDKEDRTLSISGLQINQSPINPGKCPICNQSLSVDEVAKTIEIYTYRLTSRSELASSTTKRIWSKYSEFEAHPFQVCKKCTEKEKKGLTLIAGSGCFAIILLFVGLIWPLAPKIVLYPIETLFVASLIFLVWAYIKYGPISPEKKLTKIALSHRKQKHPDAGVFIESELKELIKRRNLHNF